MHKIVEINYDDITIAEEYLNGHSEARCKNALWSMYNVLIEMLDAPTFDGRQMPAYISAFNMLYLLSKNAMFRDGDMDTLVWLGEFGEGEVVSAEKYQYIPEEYGFVYSDFVYRDGVKPKKKIDVRNLQRLSLSYTGGDYEDVIFGLKLFADICARHSWPFFRFLDLRVAFKNAAELGLPLGQLWDKPYAEAKVSVEEMCHYFLMDTYLLAGIDSLFALAKQFKMRNKEKSCRSYTFTYKSENVMNIDNHETFDSLEIMLNIGRGEDAAKLLKSLPDNLRAEYIGNLFRLHGEANCIGCWHSAAIQFEEAGGTHWIATCNFGYRRHNPTAEQFGLIAQIITMRINAIDEQKATQKAAAKENEAEKVPKPKSLPASQKAERTKMFKSPNIQDCCNYFIKDKALKEALMKLVDISRDLGLPFKLKNQKRYDARYKLHYMIKVRIEDDDNCDVTIFCDCWRENPEAVKAYILSLPDEIKQKYAAVKQTHCRTCKTIACEIGYNMKDAGEDVLVCPKWGYEFHNPKPEQIGDIKLLIDVMMGYVDTKR